MRSIRSFTAVIVVSLLAWACDALGPGPGRPFGEDRQYVLHAENGAWCTATPGAAGCTQVMELHADGTARVPYGSLVLEAQYLVRGGRVDVSPNEPAIAALRFDLSQDGNTLTERSTGRVWLRYELLPHLTRTRALA
jgi:hypothetical protein